MEEINKKLITSLSKDKNVEWKYVPARGAAGGILVTWDNEKFLCRGVERGRVLPSCVLENRRDGESWVFSSIYYRGS